MVGGSKCKTIGCTTTKAYEAVKTIETAPVEEVMTSALEAIGEGTIIMAFNILGGEVRELETENKKIDTGDRS